MDTASIRGEENESCPRCKGKVFEAERMRTKTKVFHKNCLSCLNCGHALNYSSMLCDREGEVFCKPCYNKLFADNKQNEYLSLNKGREAAEGDKDACLKCNHKVFKAEGVYTRSGPYHMTCLGCCNCHKVLDQTNLYEGPQGTIFCKKCYSQKHGHRSRSRSLGPVDYSKYQTEDDDPDQCQGCKGKIFGPEKFTTCFGSFHTPCFKCEKCSRSLHLSPETACSRNGLVICKQCFTREKSQSRKAGVDEDGVLLYAKSIVDCQSILADEDDPNKCLRCCGKVFDAERMSMKCGQFHKRCFTCFDCHKYLDYSTANDSPVSEVFCNFCYSKSFGPSAIPLEIESRFRTGTIKTSDGNSCPRCEGAVFDAEKVCVSGGKVYHKFCARCCLCNTLLTSLNLSSDKEGNIFCGGCFSRRYGGATYRGAGQTSWVDTSQFQSGTQNIKTQIKPAAKPEEGCRRCCGEVFEAEKIVVSSDMVYHKFCLSCLTCNKTLDSLKIYITPDKEISCKGCYRAIMQMENVNTNPATDSIKASSQDKAGCPVCCGKVYEAEKVVTKTQTYHKRCFACCRCKHSLDNSNFVEGSNNKVYCKTCYSREVGDNSHHKFGERNGVKAGEGDKSGCLRCGDKVFSVDKVLGRTGVYHKQCLSCGGCATKLSVTSYNCASDGDIYCKHCYQQKFGVRGRAGSVSRIQASDIITTDDDPNNCLRCGGRVYPAEKMLASSGVFHRSCFRCVNCSRTLDSYSCNCGEDGEIYCKNCYQEEFGTLSRQSRSRTGSRAQSRAASRPRVRSRSGSIPNLDSIEGNRIIADAIVNTTSIKAREDDIDACPRCQGKVFEAEKMVAKNRVYHRKCFSCEECKRSLDYLSVNEGLNNSIYCKTCYNKLFGPRVRTFDEDQARKYLESTLQSFIADSGQKGCHRCKAVVYPNEELYSGGHYYHKNCSKCLTCARKLDFNSIYDGSDKEIYCKGCYGRKFGTAGFRGIISK